MENERTGNREMGAERKAVIYAGEGEFTIPGGTETRLAVYQVAVFEGGQLLVSDDAYTYGDLDFHRDVGERFSDYPELLRFRDNYEIVNGRMIDEHINPRRTGALPESHITYRDLDEVAPDDLKAFEEVFGGSRVR